MNVRMLSRLVTVSAGCLLLAAAASAQAPAQTKVGIINVQRAVVDTAEIKKASAEMEAKYKPKQDEMAKLQGELQGIQQKLQTPDITPQAQQELTALGQRRQRELQRMTEDLQAEVDRERNDILGRAGQRMREVVQKLAEARGFDVIIDVSNTVYFKPALDLTQEAIAEYDKAYPVK